MLIKPNLFNLLSYIIKIYKHAKNQSKERTNKVMEIRAEIKQVLDGNKPTKAFADVVIDNSVVIHGVRLGENEKGRYIAMPRERWTGKDGQENSRDVAHPISSSARKQIQDAVSGAYDTFLLNGARE